MGYGLLRLARNAATAVAAGRQLAWKIAPQVEGEIAEIFANTKLPIADRVTHATERLLAARAATIPDRFYREAAEENLRRLSHEIHAFGAVDPYPELEIFRAFDPDYTDLTRLRTRDFIPVTFRALQRDPSLSKKLRRAQIELGTIRQIRAQRSGAASHSEIGKTFLSLAVDWRTLAQRVPWSSLMAHEAEHVASQGGANGRFARFVVHGRAARWNMLLNPLSPITNRLATWSDEGRAIGGSWELLSRVPEQMRTRLIDEIATELPLNPLLLQNGSRRAVLKELERKFADVVERKRATQVAISIMELRNAGLGKETFIRTMRPWAHYDLWGIATFGAGMVYRASAQEGMMAAYVAQKIGYGVKVAAWSAGGYYLFSDS